MKLQNLIVIFIIIILPVMLITSLYISTGLRTIELQARYDTGLINATHDAIYAFEQNTANIKLSDNPEIKRSIINSSIKMFEKSLCHTCNISSYNTNEIEQYIPAIVFGMYDGFYMYAPSNSNNPKTGEPEYKHNLKNYVYYSETLEGIGQGGSDIVITYSLDNYVTVSGDFAEPSGEVDEGYITRSGYLTVYTEDFWNKLNGSYNGKKYRDISIKNGDAAKYYWEAYVFTEWFNINVGEYMKDSNNKNFLKISENNDPEDENSPFVQHKRTVIKNKIEGVLNSSITAYSQKTLGNVYKMPKLTEEDWNKVYSNISMITFFQGKNIGFIRYNGYCVLNSTNNNEYVNPNLMYFIEGEDDSSHYYHDIRCQAIEDKVNLVGYKIGAFRPRKVEQTDDRGDYITDANGNILYEYKYDHQALACYECVNVPFGTNKSIYDYIWQLGDSEDEKDIKSAYWTYLARERYNSKRVNAAKIRVTSKDGTRVGYYNEIDTAIGDCGDGGTIEILEELDITKRLAIGNENSKTNPKTITITGKITTTQDIFIHEGVTVNMNNLTLTKVDGKSINDAINVINNNGNLTINNSTITKIDETDNANDETVIKNRSVARNVTDPETPPNLTINNSVIKNNKNKATIINERGSVTINYSDITKANDSKTEVIIITRGDGVSGDVSAGDVTINSNQVSDEMDEMVINNGGNLTINVNN